MVHELRQDVIKKVSDVVHVGSYSPVCMEAGWRDQNCLAEIVRLVVLVGRNDVHWESHTAHGVTHIRYFNELPYFFGQFVIRKSA